MTDMTGTAVTMTGETACGIAPTRRLYEEDAYIREFGAEILSVLPAEGSGKEAVPGRFRIILEATAFFPEGGGQSPDTGRIAGFRVEDVQIRRDGVIEHTVSIPEAEDVGGILPQSLQPGMTAACELDWQRRFGFMQCHTGEHILSGTMHRLYGFDNIGFHLSDHSVTLDVNGQLTEEQIDALEQTANEAVWRNVPVAARFPSDEELKSISYRSKKEVEGPLRLVTVEGVDVCACCAPHVRCTGEIGLIKILRVLRYNGGMRLTIACGRRGLTAVQAAQHQAEQVSHLTNRPQEEIADGVDKVLGELQQSRLNNGALQERIARLRLENAQPDRNGNVWVFEDSLSVIPQRNLVNSLCGKYGTDGGSFCGVFAGSGEKGYTYIVGACGTADARTVSRLLAQELSARGGGKPQMVQGSVKADKAAIREVLGKGAPNGFYN